jgi:hypothetical protein
MSEDGEEGLNVRAGGIEVPPSVLSFLTVIFFYFWFAFMRPQFGQLVRAIRLRASGARAEASIKGLRVTRTKVYDRETNSSWEEVSYLVSYAFVATAPDGARFRVNVRGREISRTHYGTMQEGDLAEVLYDPAHPGYCRLRVAAADDLSCCRISGNRWAPLLIGGFFLFCTSILPASLFLNCAPFPVREGAKGATMRECEPYGIIGSWASCGALWCSAFWLKLGRDSSWLEPGTEVDAIPETDVDQNFTTQESYSL